MKFTLLFSILFSFSTLAWAETQDQTKQKQSAEQSATPPQQAEAQSATTTQAEAAPAPHLFFGYNFYHYQMKGHDAANTNIYKFGESTVDLSLLSATWLYSPSWTFVALIPHITNRVETIYEPTAAGLNFKTIDTTRGLGDLRLMAITPVSVDPAHLTMVDIGVTAPTGSINEYFTSAPTQRAAYNMQLGSGTPDLILGATVTNTSNQLVSSARGEITVRGGKNANGYALGNQFLTKLSSIYNVNSYFQSGLVGNYRIRGAVLGKDEKYELHNGYVSPVTTIAGDGHQFYHATQENWDLNVMAKAQTPSYGNVNAALEVGVPVWQGMSNKDDVDLDINYYAAASLTASF